MGGGGAAPRESRDAESKPDKPRMRRGAPHTAPRGCGVKREPREIGGHNARLRIAAHPEPTGRDRSGVLP